MCVCVCVCVCVWTRFTWLKIQTSSGLSCKHSNDTGLHKRWGIS
jgi:hypothetical protein